MRIFDLVKQLAYHLRAKVHQWGKGKQTLRRPSISKDSKSKIKAYQRKDRIFLENTDPSGHGGNTSIGSLCVKLLTEHRALFISLVPAEYRDDFQTLCCRLCVKVYIQQQREG